MFCVKLISTIEKNIRLKKKMKEIYWEMETKKKKKKKKKKEKINEITMKWKRKVCAHE